MRQALISLDVSHRHRARWPKGDSRSPARPERLPARRPWSQSPSLKASSAWPGLLARPRRPITIPKGPPRPLEGGADWGAAYVLGRRCGTHDGSLPATDRSGPRMRVRPGSWGSCRNPSGDHLWSMLKSIVATVEMSVLVQMQGRKRQQLKTLCVEYVTMGW